MSHPSNPTHSNNLSDTQHKLPNNTNGANHQAQIHSHKKIQSLDEKQLYLNEEQTQTHSERNITQLPQELGSETFQEHTSILTGQQDTNQALAEANHRFQPNEYETEEDCDLDLQDQFAPRDKSRLMNNDEAYDQAYDFVQMTESQKLLANSVKVDGQEASVEPIGKEQLKVIVMAEGQRSSRRLSKGLHSSKRKLF